MVEEYLLKALLSVVAMLEDAAKFGLDPHAAVKSPGSANFAGCADQDLMT